MDYQILRIELLTDPESIGYAGMTDEQAAAAIMARTRTHNRTTVPTWEVIEATIPAEWAALSAVEKQRYQTLISAGELSVKGPNTRAAFASIFGAGTQTRANLVALQTALASRAEILGLGPVTPADVARARAGG